MPYVALEWDHKIGKPMINWIVVECSGTAIKCGSVSALAPRRDVAYFVNEETAERDAKAFAEYKNAQREGRAVEPVSTGELRYHAPYAWDHNIFSPLLRWGVLEWNGADGEPGPRLDVAYFLDADTAESDARWLSQVRDQWRAENEETPPLILARKVG
ncbi:MAG: hypothetical protein ACXU86_24790 [Archangium sp.]